MEIKVCILEDEKAAGDYLITLLKKWEMENRVKLQISVFDSKKGFEEKKTTDYQIIFMDIQLKDGTGMEIARNLREQEYKGEIVFLTAFQEYVYEGYDVHALNFFLKPISYIKLDSCMKHVKRNQMALYFLYKHYDTQIKIPYRDILYFSSLNQYTEVYTITGVYKQAEALKNILLRLPEQFVQCHRAIIVNIDCVEKISGKELCLKNKVKLPISDTYLEDVRKLFLKTLR